MKTNNFFDTSALLKRAYDLKGSFLISSITLEELESIKTSSKKDDDVKMRARFVVRFLKEQDMSQVVLFKEEFLKPFEKMGIEINNDVKIIACALKAAKKENITFVTDDLCQALIARMVLDNVVVDSDEPQDEYCGIKEVQLDDNAMSDFYSTPTINHFNLLTNEYLILRNKDNEIVDKLCWTGENYRQLKYDTFSSIWFGQVKPLKDDPYQAFAADSLINNPITMISGKPGSGKTFLALAYLFSLLSKGKIDRIVVFCNPVVAKDAAKLGFYPGTVLEKLLATQAGAVLSSKLGSDIEVQHLVEQGKLILIPAGDARGYETPPNSGVYIMESQNSTEPLLRMLLQRVGDSCKVVVDGDYNEQVDMEIYNVKNGMKTMSKAFRGEDIFGQVELKQIHRSKIAEIADRMMTI